MSVSSDTSMQDLLSALTDAIIAEDDDLDRIIDQHGVSHQQIDGLVSLIKQLHLTLTGVQPSERFSQRLKQDLLGSPRWAIMNPVRRLPPRVQVAALVTIVAGFMLIFRRRLIDDAVSDIEEAPAL